VAPLHAAPDTIDFNIRQAERYLALLAASESDRRHIPTAASHSYANCPASTPVAHAASAAQQHAWNTLQAMQAQLDQWRQQKDASEGQSIGHRQERGQAQEHFAPEDAPLRNVVPVSLLSVELESAPWPRRFNANTLP
jgi:hypothetical protein